MMEKFATDQILSNYQFFIPMLVQKAFPDNPERVARLSAKIIHILDLLDKQDVKSKIAPYIPQIVELFNSGKYKELIEMLGNVLNIDVKGVVEEVGPNVGTSSPRITKKKLL